MGQLEEVAQAISAVAGAVGPAVVRIGGGWRGGLGLVVGEDKVLTNAHNVRRTPLSVSFADGRQAEALVSGVNIDGDLAVLAVSTDGIAAPAWSETPPALGTPVFGVGASAAGVRVTAGFVSSVAAAFRGPRGRRISGSVEHTAPLAAGSSGGPLVDAAGRLVGINTNRLGDGFYLALPADAELRKRVDALARGESADRPRLGVGIVPSSVAGRLRRAVGLPERDGLLVREVEPDSPAQAAGIREGDLIVGAGERPISHPDDLYDVLAAVPQSVRLKIVRGTEELTVDVALGHAG